MRRGGKWLASSLESQNHRRETVNRRLNPLLLPRNGQEVCTAIYAPILWLYEDTPFRHELEMYFDLWDPK
jgi:hypothetical protein